jgi:hypothetical protein
MDEIDLTEEQARRDEVLAAELVNKETGFVLVHRKKKMEELTPNERAQLDSAWKLRVSAKHELDDCDDTRAIPTLKAIYFDSIRKYKETHRRIGVE